MRFKSYNFMFQDFHCKLKQLQAQAVNKPRMLEKNKMLAVYREIIFILA